MKYCEPVCDCALIVAVGYRPSFVDGLVNVRLELPFQTQMHHRNCLPFVGSVCNFAYSIPAAFV